MSHLDIKKILVPFECADHTYTFLKATGKRNLEGVALWAGSEEGDAFVVKYSIIPKQNSYNLEDGLLYNVDGEELYKLGVWLHENKMKLIAQIHTHPGAAYHSETDDAYPIVTKEGSLSIVIPDFAANPMSIHEWAIYRLLPGKGWYPLNEDEIESLIEIEKE